MRESERLSAVQYLLCVFSCPLGCGTDGGRIALLRMGFAALQTALTWLFACAGRRGAERREGGKWRERIELCRTE
jgi:hypothetical protein